jgi:hypothetical protein
VLPEAPRLLHGFDVAEDQHGSMWFAWAAWGLGTPEKIELRRLGTTLGEPRTLPGLSDRNLTYPRFQHDPAGGLVLHASAQTFDYMQIHVARIPLDGGQPSLRAAPAVDFLSDHVEAGAPDALVWREANDRGLLLHVGEYGLQLPPGARSAGLSVAVHGDLVALTYDGGVYLLRRSARRWTAALLQPPVPKADGPMKREFPGRVGLQVVGDAVVVAWWHPTQGLVTWTGPAAAAHHSWPEITWQTNAGRVLGPGSKLWLGHELMTRAAAVEAADPRRASCLRDIVAVGLRELGGPGYRAGGAPDGVPAHCLDDKRPKRRR